MNSPTFLPTLVLLALEWVVDSLHLSFTGDISCYQICKRLL